ncbi:hypothetical protein [Actinoplanes regularis]|uniref:hypothetical protein n=1 Tax=Actinoplanes regularis TaxID=52697 RepID=UPI0011774BBA|nr:hypothetical protein [Actinoplanes regularis]
MPNRAALVASGVAEGSQDGRSGLGVMVGSGFGVLLGCGLGLSSQTAGGVGPSSHGVVSGAGLLGTGSHDGSGEDG